MVLVRQADYSSKWIELNLNDHIGDFTSTTILNVTLGSGRSEPAMIKRDRAFHFSCRRLETNTGI